MTLWFQKLHEELCEHQLEHSKVWKVVHWWAFFVKNIMYVSARLFQRNYVSRHWRKLIHDLRNDIRYLVNFHASSRKSRNLYFDAFLLSKLHKDLDENVQSSYVSWHWRVMQSLKKNYQVTLGFKNDWRNFVNFNASSWKFALWYAAFWVEYNASAKKSIEELSLMTLKRIQNLKKDQLFVWKLIRGI